MPMFARNFSRMPMPCVRVAAIVVSEIIERLSPNIAPPTMAPRHSAPASPVLSATDTAMGASAAMVPTEVPIEMDYMAVSSYGAAAKSSGVVKIQKDLSSDIVGKHVIIAEDILDSGLTLKFLIENLKTRKPASISIVTFLRKEVPNQADIDCFDIGFTCPNEFVVGYGLDYAEHYRNLSYVGILKPEVYR